MSSIQPAVSIRKLCKSFGSFKALDQVDFDILAGDCLLLLGSNGAGKTTLLKLISGLSRPSSGSILVNGLDLRKLPAAARSGMGFLSHALQLYAELSARENLKFFGKLYGVPDLAQRVDEVLELVELRHRADDLVRTFSRGMQQRVSIARAFLHHPSLVLLDEPHSGLDPYAAGILNKLFEGFHREGRTLVIATHNLEHPLYFANKLAILRRGQLAHWAPISGVTSDELHRLFGMHR